MPNLRGAAASQAARWRCPTKKTRRDRQRARRAPPRARLIRRSSAASSSLDGKRDQNSIILLRRDYFDLNTLQEHTSEVMAALQSVEGGKPVPVANGDVFVISVHDVFGRPYLLASFHGDTNGLATKPVLAAVDAAARARPGHSPARSLPPGRALRDRWRRLDPVTPRRQSNRRRRRSP